MFILLILITICFEICYIWPTKFMFLYKDDPELSRLELLKSIEAKLEDELKYDKDTGCKMPKLDPFASEVTKFMKKMPKVVCNTTTDWVNCYLTKCRVIKKILDSHRNIACTYKDIIYISDSSQYIGPPMVIQGAKEYKLKESDHVEVICNGLDASGQKVSWNGFKLGFRDVVPEIPPPLGREDTLNVLILGFDSSSKNGFIRHMPKSYSVLKNELEAIILNRYNIVGAATPAALFPILTGKTELELPECRKSVKGSIQLDEMPFIFYKLRDDGYRTAYFEDSPASGTFQYRFNGFRDQPTDHYLRAFLRACETSHYYGKFCSGDIPQYKLMLNITDQLDSKRFCFTFIADISHDDYNVIGTADDDVTEFLRSFKVQGRLKDTLLLFMGDHGPRYSRMRDTYQGKLEERLPLMAIVLPEKLKRSRPQAVKALEHNSEVLTTPHDIHATILDALDMRQHYNPYKIKGADLKRGLSLMEPISSNRSCSEAGIEPHWCACLKWTNVKQDDPLFKKAAEALVETVNYITHFMRSKCVTRTLTSVEWVMRTAPRKALMEYSGPKDTDGFFGKFNAKNPDIPKENYQVKITVGPGRAIYEASMVYLKDQNKFTVSSSEISRVNAYGNEANCISEVLPRLNMFCYCKSLF